MLHSFSKGQDQVTFHAFLPLFLIKNALVIAAGGACLILGSRGDYYWWLGTLLAVLVGVRLALRYATNAIKLQGYDLIFQFGMLGQRTITIPIWNADLDIRQTLFGRIFGYGTIRQQWGNEIIEVRGVGPVSILCRTISQRRHEITPLLLAQQTLDVPIFTERMPYIESQRQHRLMRDR